MTENLDYLYPYATLRQIEYLDAIREHGSHRKAAKALGVNKAIIHRTLYILKAKAAKQEPSAHDYTKTIPEGYAIKGVSQYIDKDGKIAGQWVKTSQDELRQQEAIKAAIEAMQEDIPRLPAVPPPPFTHDNLCTVYTLTDAHVGMLAWHREGGKDWDLNIAEQTLTKCFAMMVDGAPKAKTCVVAQLGDYLHYDSALNPVTPQSGHILDADGRMPKMVKVAVRILRYVIDLALLKHEKVVVLLAEGNHDITSSVWLRAMFQALYENNDRVQIIDSELPYYTYQHGETMLCWHHGHLAKNEQLPILFAAQFPKQWGNTTKRYIHTGHRHHVHIKEYPGVTVEQHPTLAARDSYAARGGWIAERQVSSITYSDTFGLVAKNVVTPEMVGL